MEKKQKNTSKQYVGLNYKIKYFEKNFEKIDEKLDKILTTLEKYRDNIKQNSYDIEKIKEDLYRDNGRECIFTKIINIENEQYNVNKKLAIFAGFISCVSYFFNKIFG